MVKAILKRKSNIMKEKNIKQQINKNLIKYFILKQQDYMRGIPLTDINDENLPIGLLEDRRNNVNKINNTQTNLQNKNINNGIIKYTEHEIANYKNGKVKIVQNEIDITNFIEVSTKLPSNSKLFFGKIGNRVATKIKNAIGIDLENFNISLKSDAIRYTKKFHSSETEKLRGQIPVTNDDFKLIPEIILYFDTIRQSGYTKQGKPSITFTKRIGNIYYLVNYVSDKSKSIDVQTMYKIKVNEKNSATAPDANIPKLTSETTSGTSSFNDINIPQSSESVNMPSVNNMQNNENNIRNLPKDPTLESFYDNALDNN